MWCRCSSVMCAMCLFALYLFLITYGPTEAHSGRATTLARRYALRKVLLGRPWRRRHRRRHRGAAAVRLAPRVVPEQFAGLLPLLAPGVARSSKVAADES